MYFLSNPGDASDFFVKKLMVEDGEQYLIGIDSREEFDNALLHFCKTDTGNLSAERKRGVLIWMNWILNT